MNTFIVFIVSVWSFIVVIAGLLLIYKAAYKAGYVAGRAQQIKW